MQYDTNALSPETVVCLCSFRIRLLQLPLCRQLKVYLSFKTPEGSQQCRHTHSPNHQIFPPHSSASLSQSRESNTKSRYSAFRASLIRSPPAISDILRIYTPSWQLYSSADSRVLILSLGVSYLEPSPTFCPTCYFCQCFQIFLWKQFSFHKTVSSFPLP